jgi:hypothetical protein
MFLRNVRELLVEYYSHRCVAYVMRYPTRLAPKQGWLPTRDGDPETVAESYGQYERDPA